jgi:hypothetical protein
MSGVLQRRKGKLAISWSADGLIGRVSLDGQHWASVEWSKKRRQRCIEVVEGHCLAHAASIRGQAASELPGNTRALLVSLHPTGGAAVSKIEVLPQTRSNANVELSKANVQRG